MKRPESLQGRSVLVVDDNRDAATATSTILRMLGHRSEYALGADSALALAQEVQPDIVFIDIVMPDMDGFELLRRLREQPELGRARCYALTGYCDPGFNAQLRNAGFDGQLVKPASVADLEAAIEGLPVAPHAMTA